MSPRLSRSPSGPHGHASGSLRTKRYTPKATQSAALAADHARRRGPRACQNATAAITSRKTPDERWLNSEYAISGPLRMAP